MIISSSSSPSSPRNHMTCCACPCPWHCRNIARTCFVLCSKADACRRQQPSTTRPPALVWLYPDPDDILAYVCRATMLNCVVCLGKYRRHAPLELLTLVFLLPSVLCLLFLSLAAWSRTSTWHPCRWPTPRELTGKRTGRNHPFIFV